MAQLQIYSWNVNGIRAVIKNGFLDFLNQEKPDILCLQEVKIHDSAREREKFDFPGYTEYWNGAKRPGYSGTAILVKDSLAKSVLSHKTELGAEKFDSEGRVQILEMPKFYLINAYYPNARHDLSRLKFKNEFNALILKHAQKLEKKKPVIITGDYNVAHQEIDLKNPKENRHSAGFTDEERADMDLFLKNGFIDSFRELHPDEIKYTWWSYRSLARQRNVGWRIDYFCLSKKLKSKITYATILDKVKGSDHCPVSISLSI